MRPACLVMKQCAGLEEAERGDTIALTDDEADAWAKTGELPKRVT
jgi:hypothetical protein